MKLRFLIMCMSIASVISVHAENMYFFGKASFNNAQFWERQVTDSSGFEDRKVMSNFTGATIGIGMEWVIWDLGIKRGSRIYLMTGIDLALSGLNFLGQTPDSISYSPISEIDVAGGAFYSGIDYSLYFGGTFPKMNLKWGFGSDFFFMFPSWSSKITEANEQFAFYATPSILIGYDFFIPNSKIKITPALKTGITTVPLIPDSFIPDYEQYSVTPENWYSGLFIDLSVSISFTSIEWKK